MIYAKLFKNISIGDKFVERFTDGSQLVYRKTSAGKALLVEMTTKNAPMTMIHKVGDTRRIAHNNAFPLYADVIREMPVVIEYQVKTA